MIRVDVIATKKNRKRHRELCEIEKRFNIIKAEVEKKHKQYLDCRKIVDPMANVTSDVVYGWLTVIVGDLKEILDMLEEKK